MSMNPEAVVPGVLVTPQRGWWSRNWKWFVPVSLLGMVLICCGGPAMLVFGVMRTLSSSEPYKMAVAAVQQDPQVKEALGEPITPSPWVGGAITVTNDSGEAGLVFNVTGPKGSGIVTVRGTYVKGQWGLPELRVALSDGKQIKIDTTGGDNEAPRFQP